MGLEIVELVLGIEETFGDVAKAVLGINFATILEEVGAVKEKEVWDSLVNLISDQLGVCQDELTPELDFVKDLNAG
jgi:acyl carrier protein